MFWSIIEPPTTHKKTSNKLLTADSIKPLSMQNGTMISGQKPIQPGEDSQYILSGQLLSFIYDWSIINAAFSGFRQIRQEVS